MNRPTKTPKFWKVIVALRDEPTSKEDYLTKEQIVSEVANSLDLSAGVKAVELSAIETYSTGEPFSPGQEHE